MAQDSNIVGRLPRSLRILCFGDSLTAGYTLYGTEHYPYADHLQVQLERMLSSSDVDIDVDGLSGDQVSRFYLSRLQRKCDRASTHPYDWIIVMGGTNDLGWGQQPESIYQNLKKVWRVALDTGANVLALNVIEAAASSQGLIAKRGQLNDTIAGHAEDRFYTFDLWSVVRYREIDNTERKRIWDDGLHLTSSGYKMMGDAIANRLYELLTTCEHPKNVRMGARADDILRNDECSHIL